MLMNCHVEYLFNWFPMQCCLVNFMCCCFLLHSCYNDLDNICITHIDVAQDQTICIFLSSSMGMQHIVFVTPRVWSKLSNNPHRNRLHLLPYESEQCLRFNRWGALTSRQYGLAIELLSFEDSQASGKYFLLPGTHEPLGPTAAAGNRPLTGTSCKFPVTLSPFALLRARRRSPKRNNVNNINSKHVQ